jgi:glycosyltransferase involved in cell wall biosynthesis
LEKQLHEADAELLIVDDGSSDSTEEIASRWIERRDVNGKVLLQPARGPAAARNAGIAASRSTLILFIGDDIYPEHGLLREHLGHHRRYPDEQVAVLGQVTWDPALEITPLMRWLEDGGPQFCYTRIKDPLDVPPAFFWTANLSVKRSFLQSKGIFSEEFPFAAFEDVELGVRLGKQGLVLHYEPRAVGYHHHPITLHQSLERMKRLAAGALLASETEPSLVYLRSDAAWRRIRRRLVFAPFTQRAVRAMGHLFVRLPPLRKWYFGFAHDLFYKAELRRLVVLR